MAKKKNFDPNKPPRLKSGESASSFRERVKNWEEITGKKATYSDSLMNVSKENRILQGEGTLGIGTDYTRQEDYIDSYNRERTRKRLQKDPSGSTSKEQQDKGTDLRNLYGMDDDVDPGDIMGLTPLPTDQALKQQEDYEIEAEAQEWGPGGQPSGSYMPEGVQFSDQAMEVAKANQAAMQNVVTTRNAGQKTLELAALGGQEYTTNFQEAMRHANKTQAWADTIDSAPLEKSNVFSKAEMDWGQYKAGDTLGVMTRNQRRAYDEAVAQAQLTEDEVGAMEDTGRSASETKAIQSKDGLETVIGGMDTSKASKSEGVSFKGGKDDDDENLLSKIFRPRKG